jgi:hypothetical protein
MQPVCPIGEGCGAHQAFVTVTQPDGSWRVYGVGNLC